MKITSAQFPPVTAHSMALHTAAPPAARTTLVVAASPAAPVNHKQ